MSMIDSHKPATPHSETAPRANRRTKVATTPTEPNHLSVTLGHLDMREPFGWGLLTGRGGTRCWGRWRLLAAELLQLETLGEIEAVLQEAGLVPRSVHRGSHLPRTAHLSARQFLLAVWAVEAAPL